MDVYLVHASIAASMRETNVLLEFVLRGD